MFEKPHHRRKASPDWNHGHRLQDDPNFDAAEPIQIEQDGRILVGDTWILPTDYVDVDVEQGRLISLKGATLPGTFELQPASIHVTTEPQG